MTGLSVVGSSRSGVTKGSAAKSGGRSPIAGAAAAGSGKKAKPIPAARPPPPPTKATAATTKHPLTPGFYLIDSGTSYLYLLGDAFALFDAVFCTAVMQGRPTSWSCGGANGGGDASTWGYQV